MRGIPAYNNYFNAFPVICHVSGYTLVLLCMGNELSGPSAGLSFEATEVATVESPEPPDDEVLHTHTHNKL